MMAVKSDEYEVGCSVLIAAGDLVGEMDILWVGGKVEPSDFREAGYWVIYLEILLVVLTAAYWVAEVVVWWELS